MVLVSPSRSSSFEFSGTTFLVEISGSPWTTYGHHSIALTFLRLRLTRDLSSIDQSESSTLTAARSGPSMIGGCPRSPIVRCCFSMRTTTSFPFTGPEARSGTEMSRSCRVCVHE
eukprot:Amastigsp_a853039_18.p2 type:complete len:115 gc:universal Amastigsp_a853039_18:194-538(+)